MGWCRGAQDWPLLLSATKCSVRKGLWTAGPTASQGSVNRPHGCQRLRNPDNYDKLTELAKSTNESGLINPITIRPHGTGYSIVARVLPAHGGNLTKWETIKCYVRQDLDDDGAGLIEIHENLIRADLTPGEKRDHLIKRKEIWERRHPEDKQQALTFDLRLLGDQAQVLIWLPPERARLAGLTYVKGG